MRGLIDIATGKPMTRRECVKGLGGIAAMLASGKAPAALMRGVGLRTAMGGGGKLSAKDYVQDGLVAMWDGIENAGVGVHDASAETWKDLVGTNDFTSFNGGCTFAENNVAFNSQQFLTQQISLQPYYNTKRPFSIELVYSRNTPILYAQTTILNFGYYSYGTSYCGWLVADGNKVGVCGAASTGFTYDELVPNQIHCVTGKYDGDTECKIYINGEYRDTKSPGGTNANSRPQVIINSPYGAKPSVGCSIYCIRVYYDTTLTDAQIRHNYAIDKARFNLP